MVTDGCHLGSCPGLFLGGCHGTDEHAVFAELRDLVEQAIALYRADVRPLPQATAGRGLTIRLQERHVA